MAGTHRFLFFVSAIAIGGCVVVSAQDPQSPPAAQGKEIPAPASVDEMPSGHVKVVPAPTLLPSNSPFAIEGTKAKPERSIRMLPEGQMSREDRDLLANAESSIQEKAGIENLDFSAVGWSYEELECPALPKHVFLRFTRDAGTPQASMFSVAIPRTGEGRMHLIPIMRKGFSLFSPAPIGPMTIAAFNRIRAEEGEGVSADWLGTGLCYAALAGANPQIGDVDEQQGELYSAAMPPTLTIASEGGATIRFADESNPAKPMEWSMVFDPKGKLVNADHEAAYVASGKKKD
jgi:hypothetical protein